MEYEKIDDLKYIKKYYGENMSHLCRRLFPTILETPGLLYYILSSKFSKSKSLYGDITSASKIISFQDFIYNTHSNLTGNKSKKSIILKPVIELFDDAGYDLYKCKTDKDVQKFKKYYEKGEELCTFNDPFRVDNYDIFFAVKKDVNHIKRSDYKNPQREDLYSTSVLCLQFSKGDSQNVSIKSRYNHKVDNPDATYSNNLERIQVGLTNAFMHDYGYIISSDYETNFELRGYWKANDGKFYKYNYEINNIHYCVNNIILDNGKVIDTYADKGRYTFMDYFILDEKEKKIIVYDKKIKDSFADTLQNITNIEITNKNGYKEIKLTMEGNKEAIIKLDDRGRIIGYINNHIKEVKNNFLEINKILKELSMDSLEKCGSCFLRENEQLEELCLPKLRICDEWFLADNKPIKKLYLPLLEIAGNQFLYSNYALEELSLPSLIECKDHFIKSNQKIKTVFLPNLKRCGRGFLACGWSLKELFLPRLEYCSAGFLSENKRLSKLSLPKLKECENGFLYNNLKLKYLYLPNLERFGDNFLFRNLCVCYTKLPKLKETGKWYFYDNILQREIIRHILKINNKKYIDADEEKLKKI